MADAVIGVTTGYTLSASVATAITSNIKGSSHRRSIMISNLDASIVVYVAFGTANAATLPSGTGAGHPIAAGATMLLGGPPTAAQGGFAGPVAPSGDISMIAASGTPKVAVTILG